MTVALSTPTLVPLESTSVQAERMSATHWTNAGDLIVAAPRVPRIAPRYGIGKVTPYVDGLTVSERLTLV